MNCAHAKFINILKAFNHGARDSPKIKNTTIKRLISDTKGDWAQIVNSCIFNNPALTVKNGVMVLDNIR